MKHHYIPAFYLRQWASKGFLWEMRKTYGKLYSREVGAEGTGFQEDLYRIKGVSRELSQHFERQFMHMVDTQASEAMHMIYDGRHRTWTVKQRDAWVRLLMSLMFRNPEAVAQIKDQIHLIWDEAVRGLHAEHERRRRANDPDTFDEFVAKIDPHAPAKAASNFLQTIMNSDVIGNGILSLKWGRVFLKNSRFPLMTSDRPLDIPLGLSDPNAYITLPIGPYMLFTACKDDIVLRKLTEGDHTNVARMVNEKVVRQAREYVWCTDAAGYAFVKKHISTLPDRDIMSERAKRLSLAEARGEPKPV